MARKTKLVVPGEWWRHMRWKKRSFWKRERVAYKKAILRGAE